MINIQQLVISGIINPYELLDLWVENPLSKEDIESLGFKHVVNKGFDHSYDEYWASGQWYIKEIWINQAKGIEIGSGMYEKQFQGNIKNKNELKKILKMCGYEITGTE
jgi:hypothetical protein